MIGAIILGIVAGAIARWIVPGDALSSISGITSWIVTLILGLVGAWVGWAVFTQLLGIGDNDMFDLGGIVGAIVGAVIVLLAFTWIMRAVGRSKARA